MKFPVSNLQVFMPVVFMCLVACSPASKNKTSGNDFSDSVIQQVIQMEKKRVLPLEEELIALKPVTVTDDVSPRNPGGRHDFFSEGPYWWPDPKNPGGPYIRNDGYRNPDRFVAHDDNLRKFSWIVSNLTSAYLITGEEKYAKAATLHLKAWFTDTATLMNPNMLYAQAIKGVCTGRGVGIIDAVPLIEVAQSVMILEKNKKVNPVDIARIKSWFSQFLEWLTTQPYGVDEMKAKNNHGMWWYAQAASYARLTGNKKILEKCREDLKAILLPDQMAADGSFPLELARTKPYSYSLFNLDAISCIAWILADRDFDAWDFQLADGRGLNKGIDYMLPYIRNIQTWPFSQDVDNWEKQPGPRMFILFAALEREDPSLFSLWKSIREKNGSNEELLSLPLKNPLIWINKD